MADSHCAELGYCALSFGASAKSCAHSVRSYLRSFGLQRIMLELSALKRVVYILFIPPALYIAGPALDFFSKHTPGSACGHIAWACA